METLNWRFREELGRQLLNLIKTYDTVYRVKHMIVVTGFAIYLLSDKVSAVRMVAMDAFQFSANLLSYSIQGRPCGSRYQQTALKSMPTCNVGTVTPVTGPIERRMEPWLLVSTFKFHGCLAHADPFAFGPGPAGDLSSLLVDFSSTRELFDSLRLCRRNGVDVETAGTGFGGDIIALLVDGFDMALEAIGFGELLTGASNFTDAIGETTVAGEVAHPYSNHPPDQFVAFFTALTNGLSSEESENSDELSSFLVGGLVFVSML
ncbi:hypothetical protein Bhyg_08234 [Pseudolycoriella hygida]|uniref:Uncharacterized protein n=1 Tax=Pseudolycoriella hygida TaxID=35572 RepID=A0A9Q0N4F3_9DIPT|nr:hypothetical protein Bhyg_08234 [Pseudolycoriella hygida]